MGESAMNSFKNSVILMGVDWSKAANFIAKHDIKLEDKRLAKIVEVLDRDIRSRK